MYPEKELRGKEMNAGKKRLNDAVEAKLNSASCFVALAQALWPSG
jgi:hypothetical protein